MGTCIRARARRCQVSLFQIWPGVDGYQGTHWQDQFLPVTSIKSLYPNLVSACQQPQERLSHRINVSLVLLLKSYVFCSSRFVVRLARDKIFYDRILQTTNGFFFLPHDTFGKFHSRSTKRRCRFAKISFYTATILRMVAPKTALAHQISITGKNCEGHSSRISLLYRCSTLFVSYFLLALVKWKSQGTLSAWQAHTRKKYQELLWLFQLHLKFSSLQLLGFQ